MLRQNIAANKYNDVMSDSLEGFHEELKKDQDKREDESRRLMVTSLMKEIKMLVPPKEEQIPVFPGDLPPQGSAKLSLSQGSILRDSPVAPSKFQAPTGNILASPVGNQPLGPAGSLTQGPAGMPA